MTLLEHSFYTGSGCTIQTRKQKRRKNSHGRIKPQRREEFERKKLN